MLGGIEVVDEGVAIGAVVGIEMAEMLPPPKIGMVRFAGEGVCAVRPGETDSSFRFPRIDSVSSGVGFRGGGLRLEVGFATEISHSEYECRHEDYIH